MEENQPKTGKYALNYGLLSGGIGVIFGLMLYSMDMHYQGDIMTVVISLVITLAVIILALIQFKKANNGFMSFGQALKIGVGLCLIGGIIAVIFNQIMANFIDPDMLGKAIEFQKNKLLETTSLTATQIDEQLAMGKKFQTPVMQIAFGLLGSIFFGFILTLIPALVLKKQENLD